jgi:hypothetical protein
MCVNPVTQPDTLSEGVCTGFIYASDGHMLAVHRGLVYVQDMEHGWREIHPVMSIAVQ